MPVLYFLQVKEQSAEAGAAGAAPPPLAGARRGSCAALPATPAPAPAPARRPGEGAQQPLTGASRSATVPAILWKQRRRRWGRGGGEGGRRKGGGRAAAAAAEGQRRSRCGSGAGAEVGRRGEE